mmetsp:Transcript_23021/g.91298  ORF Transcript_23021/g.91298 Transcript_23021/m.91298 type:complete len:234 (-) Transcript_23021:199-900(-)
MRRRGAACDRETDDRGPQHWKSASRAILASPSRPSSQHRRRLECAHGFARARRDTDVWSRTTRRGQGAATETDVDKTRTSYCTVHLTIGRVPSATEDRVPPRNNDDRTECQLRSPRRNDVTTVMRRSPSGKTLRAMRDILGVRRHPHAQRAPTREPFYAGMRPHVRSAPRGRRRRPGSLGWAARRGQDPHSRAADASRRRRGRTCQRRECRLLWRSPCRQDAYRSNSDDDRSE